MKLFVAGLSYRTAPVDVRERLAVSRPRLGCSACTLKIRGRLQEVVVLSTCNRVEIYGVTEGFRPDFEELFQLLHPGERNFAHHGYLHEDDDAIRHLFSVSGGLDSMVLGETEITGQVKHAYEVAREARLAGKVLNRTFQTALQTAKEIRTRTQVGQGATSVGSATVELAEKIFGGDLSGKTIMILGAGKMGEACVKHLAKKGASSVLVSNRSYERAEALANEFGGRAVRLESCLQAMGEADIVVSSTGSPDLVLFRHQVESILSARRGRPLFLIDIAVPRDIDPEIQSLENVYLYNIDHLEALVQENVRLRAQQLEQCRSIIEGRTGALMARFASARREKIFVRTQPETEWALAGAAACCV